MDTMCDIAIEERDGYKEAIEQRKVDACKLADEVIEQMQALKEQVKGDKYMYFLPKEELESKHRELISTLCHLEYVHNMHRELHRMTSLCSVFLGVGD